MMWGILHWFLGKSVVIDGCHVGQAMEVEVEEQIGSAPTIVIKLVVPPECIGKIAEYEHIMEVMGDEV